MAPHRADPHRGCHHDQCDNRELSVALSDDELATRKAQWKGPKPTQYATGAIWKFAKLVAARAGVP